MMKRNIVLDRMEVATFANFIVASNLADELHYLLLTLVLLQSLHFSRALSHFTNRNRGEDINRAPRFSLATRTVKDTMELSSYKKKDPERVRLLEQRVGPLDPATKARRSVPLETFETQTDIRTSGASPP